CCRFEFEFPEFEFEFYWFETFPKMQILFPLSLWPNPAPAQLPLPLPFLFSFSPRSSANRPASFLLAHFGSPSPLWPIGGPCPSGPPPTSRASRTQAQGVRLCHSAPWHAS